ncbi:MAG TPA: DUF1501 domain-containing protein [Acidimicrobiales bacterium]|nr:DUF1501 domain-containing protein [Acidimicrobiales bacterium]
MALSRREFLAGAGGLSLGAAVFGVAGPAFGDAPADPRALTRNRLVVIFLEGGNDGLNTIVPRGDVAGAPRLSVYRRVRPSLAYKPEVLLPLDRVHDADQLLGLNPRLAHLHGMYRDGRVAIVQGVDYPNHNYSHFASADIWHTGDPTKTGASGWLGRHLDRVGVGDGELRAAAIASKVPLMLQGRVPAAAMTSIGAMRFADGTGTAAAARHRALAAMGGGRSGDPVRQRVGASLRQAVDVVSDLGKTQAPTGAGSGLANSMLTARTLLEQNLGVECVYVYQGGYDTHTAQQASQERLLGELDTALETFWLGTEHGVAVAGAGAMKPEVAGRTLVMVVSEFGRRIGEANGGVGVAGTDHGAAAPVVLVGPPAAARPSGAATLVPGLHGDHPDLGTPNNPADNLVMTTDLRHLYQSVLQAWLGDPDPIYSRSLPGLFADAAPASGAAAARRNSIVASRALDATATSSGPLGIGGGPGARVAGETTARRLGGTDGRALHPVSVAAALAFNAFVAAVVVRSGRFRAALADWRGDNAAP